MSNITVEGILSYPSIFKASKIANDPTSTPRFSCSVLIKKGDPQIERINQKIEEVKNNTFPNGMPPKSTIHVLVDCAVEFPNDVSLRDYMVFRAHSKEDRRPVVCDVDQQDVIDPSKACAGDICKMSVFIFAFKTMKGGISAGLNGIMLLYKQGKLGKLGNTITKEEMFGNVLRKETFQSKNTPIMTDKAGSTPYSDFIENGWTHDQLVDHGYVHVSIPF